MDDMKPRSRRSTGTPIPKHKVEYTTIMDDGTTGKFTRPNDVERTFTYSRSGEPGVFSNHQEIMLEPFRGWA